MISILYQLIFLYFTSQFNNLPYKNNLISNYNKYLRTNDLEKATYTINNLTSIDPVNELMVFNSGSLSLIKGEVGKAKVIFNRLLKSENIKLRTNALVNISIINIVEKDTITAISNLENALVLDQNQLQARNNLELLKKKFKNKNSKTIYQTIENQTNNQTESKQKDNLTRLNKINLTNEQALKIFETIGNNSLTIKNGITIKSENNNNFSDW